MWNEGLVALIILWADHAGEDQVEDELCWCIWHLKGLVENEWWLSNVLWWEVALIIYGWRRPHQLRSCDCINIIYDIM